MDADTYDAIRLEDTSRAFGGWATFDDVPNHACARGQLAIKSDMKRDVSYVIQVEITQAVDAQVGIDGKQPGAAGDGNQLHFNLPREQRTDAFKIVGDGALR